jgi:trimeric autotransporter adhesin
MAISKKASRRKTSPARGAAGQQAATRGPADRPPGPADSRLAQRVRALERKLEHVTSVLGAGGLPEVVITGANLRIVNGLGTTDTVNALGNLIVGYNEPRTDGATVQTGSHNIVGGQFNNFSSFGGLVVGTFNEISDDFSSVSGGVRNIASGPASSISGGINNTADGSWSSVSGGQSNRAIGNFSAVSGGETNTANGPASSISGGNANTASEYWSSISGGARNTASGRVSVVSGGNNRTAAGEFDWVAGGLFQDQ